MTDRAAQPEIADTVHVVDELGACRAAVVTGVQQTGDAPATADVLVLDASPPDGLANVRPRLGVYYARHDPRRPALGSWHHRRECPR
jgi:hypothetical protein